MITGYCYSEVLSQARDTCIRAEFDQGSHSIKVHTWISLPTNVQPAGFPSPAIAEGCCDELRNHLQGATIIKTVDGLKIAGFRGILSECNGWAQKKAQSTSKLPSIQMVRIVCFNLNRSQALIWTNLGTLSSDLMRSITTGELGIDGVRIADWMILNRIR